MRTSAARDDKHPGSSGLVVRRWMRARGRSLQMGRAAFVALVLALMLVLTLSACTQSGTNGPGTTPNPNQGTLAGRVVAGPTCPVERAESPCPPRPVPNRQVSVQTPGGQVVATATTDAQGNFAVTLAPGTYVVLVPSTGTTIYPRQTAPASVTVYAGETTHVQILLDTGIR